MTTTRRRTSTITTSLPATAFRPMNERDYPQVDTTPTEHEQEVAREVEGESDTDDVLDDPTVDPGRRPTSEEDLAADMRPGEDR
jgi:hypothetical protein